MLVTQVERYVSLRQTLGYKLHKASGNLRAFARFAADRGDTHVRISTAVDWATRASSPYVRYIRLRDVAHLARFLHAEDPTHEVPSNPFHAPKRRPLPYIYAPQEIAQLVGAASRLRESYPLRRQIYATMLGLIAATGLRISEALDLRLHDVLPDSVLQIRRTKFGKSRLVPLHPTTANALECYLEEHRPLAVTDDHVFLSAGDQRIAASTVQYTFRRMCRLAGIAPARTRPPRIHDLRHYPEFWTIQDNRCQPLFSRNLARNTRHSPTSSSWLNLVERFFGELTSEVVREGSFESLRELVRAIESYLAERNQNPKKYVWRASGLKILQKIHRAKEALAAADVIIT